jgi:hypothetical protein
MASLSCRPRRPKRSGGEWKSDVPSSGRLLRYRTSIETYSSSRSFTTSTCERLLRYLGFRRTPPRPGCFAPASDFASCSGESGRTYDTECVERLASTGSPLRFCPPHSCGDPTRSARGSPNRAPASMDRRCGDCGRSNRDWSLGVGGSSQESKSRGLRTRGHSENDRRRKGIPGVAATICRSRAYDGSPSPVACSAGPRIAAHGGRLRGQADEGQSTALQLRANDLRLRRRAMRAH